MSKCEHTIGFFLWMKHDDTIHLGGPLTSMRKSTLPFRHVLFTTKLHLPVTKRMCPFSVSLSSLDYKKKAASAAV